MSATVRTQPPYPQRDRSTRVQAHPRIRVQRSDGVVVLQPLGALDARLVERLRRAALETSRPVIVDLDECVLIDATAVERMAIDPQLAGRADLCFVCRDGACRGLLGTTGVDGRFAVFTRVEDALQARVFARDGYGAGWTC